VVVWRYVWRVTLGLERLMVNPAGWMVSETTGEVLGG